MKLSIIIPAYNEELTIGAILNQIQSVDFNGLEKEIIVVDDASLDRTLEKLTESSGIILIKHSENQGKGAAIKTGIAAATGDVVVFQDADLEYDPSDLPKIIAPILRMETDVVIGYRQQRGLSLKTIGNKAITLFTNFLYEASLPEYECCYKAFSKKIITSILVDSNGFEYDNELICKILRRKEKIIAIPVKYSPRNYTDGKKIGWRDGFKILWTILKYRFT